MNRRRIFRKPKLNLKMKVIQILRRRVMNFQSFQELSLPALNYPNRQAQPPKFRAGKSHWGIRALLFRDFLSLLCVFYQ